MTDRPWSTQPITGAQHDAWMAEEREVHTIDRDGMPPISVSHREYLARQAVIELQRELSRRIAAINSRDAQLDRDFSEHVYGPIHDSLSERWPKTGVQHSPEVD